MRFGASLGSNSTDVVGWFEPFLLSLLLLTWDPAFQHWMGDTGRTSILCLGVIEHLEGCQTVLRRVVAAGWWLGQ